MFSIARGAADPPLQPQSFWNQDTIEQIEDRLHQQRQDRGRNCALENRCVIVQIEAAQDRLAQAAGADQRRQRGGSDVDDRARFDSKRTALVTANVLIGRIKL